MEKYSAAGPKSSLPRPSRLPLAATKIPQPPLSAKHDVSGSAVIPRLQTRHSVATLPRSSASNVSAGSSISTAARTSGRSAASIRALPNTTRSRSSLSRPSSRGNQQRLPSPAKKSASAENVENHDQLSSLDSFRSASRQGWHDDTPAEAEEAQPVVDPPSTNGTTKRRPRPSLSDRTVESLQNLPTTPKDRRRSSFFSPGQMGPPPRPPSGLSKAGSSNGSRPGTSDGHFGQAPPLPIPKRGTVSAKPATRTSLGGFAFTSHRSTSMSASKMSNVAIAAEVPASPRSPSPAKRTVQSTADHKTSKVSSGSKTFAGRSSRSRPSAMDAFRDQPQGIAMHSKSTVGTPAAKSSSLPVEAPKTTTSPKGATAVASSTALREQIAAAKAAARKELLKSEKLGYRPDSHVNGDFDKVDAFSQVPKDTKHILRNRISSARLDGRLNIAAMDLEAIPQEVLHMYDAAAMEESNVNWAEVVDLTKLVVADNRLETIEDNVFPDVSAHDLAMDDFANGNQFGGLETLDIHGNALTSLPMGLRRLERLTSLNCAHNRLDNDAFEMISQIVTLKELRLGHNRLSGTLPANIQALQRLEILDVRANKLLGLPEAIRELTYLKFLDISSNQLTAVPMDAIVALPLRELDASHNALIGSLFAAGDSRHDTLQVLKLANNSLATLSFAETFSLPRLHLLDVTNNQLIVLPDFSALAQLVTFAAGDNKIAQLPTGFTTLEKLRHVNFTGNSLRLLDPEIGNMKSLETLILASNPLRDKKYLTMSAADIKQDLRSRIESVSLKVDAEDMNGDISGGMSITSRTQPTTPNSWSMQAGGRLDIIGQAHRDDINDRLGSFLQDNEVRQLMLGSNKLTTLPPALWLGQDLRVLDLSGNALGIDYLSDELSLPALHELNMSKCSLQTLEPLLSHLQAPQLQTLNVAINRLSGSLPILRHVFPTLTSLLAHDNKFQAVSADSLRGLHAVNLASNDIQQLRAEVGLLWDEGLRSLEVGSNAFRVPNHRVLEKGTETTMKYLRDRIPGHEMA